MINRSSDACDHCGLPAPPRKAGETTFCCQGCRGAFLLIHQWGLEDYYDLRDRLMSDAGTPVQADSSVRSRFDDLDDLRLLGASAPRIVGHDGSDRVLLCSRLAVSGIHCGACVWLIERMAPLVPGWNNARIGMHDHSIEVTYDPSMVRLSEIAKTLAGIGYRVSPWTEGSQGERYRKENRARLVQIAVAGFCAMNAMWIAIGIYAGEFSGIAESQMMLLRTAGVLLALLAVCVPGRPFFVGAWAALRTRTPHMDLPIALGIGVGAVAGVVSLFVGHADVYFDSVAVLVFLLLVGRWVQFRQQHQAADAVSLLMRMSPPSAMQIDDEGGLQRVPADSLRMGDHVLVGAGEGIAVDGFVLRGVSSVDRSLLTGESMPVPVGIGDQVEAGALNLQAAIEMEVTAPRSESRIAKLMRLVEQAAINRTPIVQLADAIGGRFVLVLLALALITCLLWWPVDPMRAASNTVALLIVACPCALALATPLAIAVTLGRAARRKLLIRSGDTLERLSKAGIVWFDKTGTLTEGRPQLVSESMDDDTLTLCASLERQSCHPIAVAIVDAASRRQLELHPDECITAVQQKTGGGIRGLVDEKTVIVGSLAFVRSFGVDVPSDRIAEVARIAKNGVSPVLLAVDGLIVSVIGIGDKLRPEAMETVSELRKRGWQVGILSGDHPTTVASVASSLCIVDEMAQGGLSPEQKLQWIDDSRRKGSTVVMVGDGVNDAAALAAADVGVAVRGGAEASLQASPVYLASGDLLSIIQLIDASAATINVIRRNFRVSLCYNFLAVTLAMTGIINPLIAAILMPISSLSVLSLTLASKTFADPKFVRGVRE